MWTDTVADRINEWAARKESDMKRKWMTWDEPTDHDKARRRFIERHGHEPDVVEEREIFGVMCTIAGPVKEGE